MVEYLAERDERWRDFLTHRIAEAERGPGPRVLAVFDASKAWMAESSPRGCSMVNAHAEISDPSHPAHAVITGQKAWMYGLFTDLAREVAPDSAAPLGRSLMLLHEGALVAHGMKTFPDPIGHARDQAELLVAGFRDPTGGPQAP